MNFMDISLIHLIIIILSITSSYIIYKYLEYDLIDINIISKNDIETFTQVFQLDSSYFNDNTTFSILEDEKNAIIDEKTEYMRNYSNNEYDNKISNLNIYNRKNTNYFETL